jgi:quinol monooxygenase YgiN
MKLTIEMKAKPGKFHELYQTLQALIPEIRGEKGCQDCRITRDVEDGEVFFLTVQWQGQPDFDRYMRSVGGAALLGAIELLSDAARVRRGHNGTWRDVHTLRRSTKKG